MYLRPLCQPQKVPVNNIQVEEKVGERKAKRAFEQFFGGE